MAFNLSMDASEIDKTLVDSRRLLDSDPATKQYVDEKATWENLQGKPTIFEGGDTLTWDGDTGGLESGVNTITYKVSDAVPNKADFVNGCSVHIVMADGSGMDMQSDGETCQSAFLDDGFFMSEDAGFIVIPYDGYVLDEMTFPKKGVYLPFIDGEFYVSSLTIPGYTGFGKEVIDPDVLPESVKDTGVEWVKFTTGEELGNGMFSATADKTMDEIISLVEAGKVVTAEIVDPGMITRVPLALCGGDLISFSTVFYAGAAMMMVLTMTKDITYSQTIPIATATS